MSKLNQAQEQTMEEILASIRRMISDDEVRSTLPRPAPEPIKAPANVSRLFAESRAVKPASSIPAAEPQFVAEAPAADNVIEMTIDQAIEDAVAEAERAPDDDEAPVAFEAAPPVIEVPRRAVEPPRAPAPAADVSRPSPPLMSARADAAVTSAFGQLATMLPGSSRTIDELVEDLLRPMLHDWLDANLPVMVERLVREEIERVSRGRR
jgi:cell pole-organizing protein PopZ